MNDKTCPLKDLVYLLLNLTKKARLKQRWFYCDHNCAWFDQESASCAMLCQAHRNRAKTEKV